MYVCVGGSTDYVRLLLVGISYQAGLSCSLLTKVLQFL